MNGSGPSRLVMPIVYGLIALGFCARLFASPHGVGLGDWDQHLFFYGSVLKNVIEYGAAPYWNPWYCGGNVLWANPQVALLSPVYPLATVTSLPLAMKLNIVLHYWVGLVGMHLLLRRVVGLRSRPVTVYLASVFTLSGAHVLHLAVGHSVFLPAFFFPLFFYAIFCAFEGGALRAVCAGSAVLALMIFAGGMHVVPMALVSAGCLAALTAVQTRRWRPVLVVALVAALGLAYAGPKLVPVAMFVGGEQFSDARELMERIEWMSLEMLVVTYTSRYPDASPSFDMQYHGWHEYANYAGSLFALFFLGSLIWIAVNRRVGGWWLGLASAGTALFTLLFSAGEFAPWAPAALARWLPFFSSYRVPSRFTIVVLLFAALAVAWVWRRLTEEGLARPARVFVTVVCVLATAELVVWNGRWFRDAFSDAPLAESFEWGGGPSAITVDAESDPYTGGAPMLRALMADRSFYDCYEPLQLARTSDPAQPLVGSDGDATVFETWFSPNQVEFSALGGTRPSPIVLNMNQAAGWTSTLGPVTLSPDHAGPTVTMAATDGGRYRFEYRPPGLWPGFGLMGLALGATAWGWRRRLPGEPGAAAGM